MTFVQFYASRPIISRAQLLACLASAAHWPMRRDPGMVPRYGQTNTSPPQAQAKFDGWTIALDLLLPPHFWNSSSFTIHDGHELTTSPVHTRQFAHSTHQSAVDSSTRRRHERRRTRPAITPSGPARHGSSRASTSPAPSPLLSPQETGRRITVTVTVIIVIVIHGDRGHPDCVHHPAGQCRPHGQYLLPTDAPRYDRKSIARAN
jgi:hypothetical protein